MKSNARQGVHRGNKREEGRDDGEEGREGGECRVNAHSENGRISGADSCSIIRPDGQTNNSK